MGDLVRVSAAWALWGKPPRSNSDYSVLASSAQPLSKPEFASVLTYFAPGTPRAERRLPSSLPWVTLSRVGVDKELYVGIAIQEPTDQVDGAGRPITRTSYFCIAYAELIRIPVSYTDLYEQLASVRLPHEDGDLIQLSIPPLDPEALAADVKMVFGEPVVATTAALLLCGPVTIIGAEGIALNERLRFFDAVAALLPYGYRAGYTASTWSDSGARHRIRLAFAARPRKDAGLIRWRDLPEAPNPGSPGEVYLRLLDQIDERSPEQAWLKNLIRFFGQDSAPRTFEQPQHAIESLRNFGLPFIVLVLPNSRPARNNEATGWTSSSAAKCAVNIASAGRLRERVQLARSQLRADLTQGVPHLGSSGEAFSFGWSARLDEEFWEVRPELRADFPWVDHWFVDHRPCIRIRVAIAEELVEDHADCEQVGGDLPASEVGVGGLVRGCA